MPSTKETTRLCPCKTSGSGLPGPFFLAIRMSRTALRTRRQSAMSDFTILQEIVFPASRAGASSGSPDCSAGPSGKSHPVHQHLTGDGPSVPHGAGGHRVEAD